MTRPPETGGSGNGGSSSRRRSDQGRSGVRRSGSGSVRSTATAMLEPGTLVLGRYRLERLLGSGGSADVWLTRDERLGRQVALKLLHPHLLPDAASRDRFVAEARAVAALSHPGIVAVHDVELEGRLAAIAFDYVPGETLEARIRREGRLRPVEAAEIAAQLAEALDAAHAAGVIHRDVKPANVLLGADGRARLVDFGIARVVQEAQAGLTRPGEVVGTLRWMAPEQLAGAAVGPATDVFGLGAVLYTMLAGRPPFDGPTPLAMAELQRVPPDPIPDVPAGLADLAMRSLRPDPAQRPGSAGELAAYLRGWLAGARIPGAEPLDGVAGMGAGAQGEPGTPADDGAGAGLAAAGLGAAGAAAADAAAASGLSAAPIDPIPDHPGGPRARLIGPDEGTIVGQPRAIEGTAATAGFSAAAAGAAAQSAPVAGAGALPLAGGAGRRGSGPGGPGSRGAGSGRGRAAGSMGRRWAVPAMLALLLVALVAAAPSLLGRPIGSSNPGAIAGSTATPTPTPTPTPSPTSSPTPTPTPSPTPTPTPSPTPTPVPFQVTSPSDGSQTNHRHLTVQGTAPAGAQVIFDDGSPNGIPTNADNQGNWSFSINLQQGPNQLSFYLASDPDQRITITVYLGGG